MKFKIIRADLPKISGIILLMLVVLQISGCAQATDFLRILNDSFGFFGVVMILGAICVLGVTTVLLIQCVSRIERNMVMDAIGRNKIRSILRSGRRGWTVERVKKLSSIWCLFESEKEELVVDHLVEIGREDLNRLLAFFDKSYPHWWLHLCFDALKKVRGSKIKDFLKDRLIMSPTYELAKTRLCNMEGILIDSEFIVESAKAHSSEAYKLAALDRIYQIRGIEEILLVFTDNQKYSTKVINHVTELLGRKEFLN